jgi:hypothetical protein
MVTCKPYYQPEPGQASAPYMEEPGRPDTSEIEPPFFFFRPLCPQIELLRDRKLGVQ